MRKTSLINSSHVEPSASKGMQVLDEQSKAYFNFINSLKSEPTRKSYKYCIEKFLGHYQMDLAQFLKLPQEEMTNLIIKYFVDKKISNQYKNLMSATLKHSCEINDVILNWKKIKKFINSDKTGNETNGRDRAYTHQEIQKILDFCDQRIRTAFLILASTGIRIGALQILKIGDLEKIDPEYRMFVIPISFSEYGKELLGRFQHVVSKIWFSVSNVKHKELVTQMRMAKFKDNGNLDKEETSNNTFDVFDSTRLALKMFEMSDKR